MQIGALGRPLDLLHHGIKLAAGRRHSLPVQPAPAFDSPLQMQSNLILLC